MLPKLNPIKRGERETNDRHTEMRKNIHTKENKKKVTRQQKGHHERQNVRQFTDHVRHLRNHHSQPVSSFTNEGFKVHTNARKIN